MTEGVPQSSAEKVHDICSDFGIEVVNDSADLTHLSYEEVRSFLSKLTDSNITVLHGSNSDEVYKCLETRQGHCAIKESGRKKAVYATSTPTVAISVAVINRKYLRSKTESFMSGFSGYGEELTFTFTPDIYELFKAQDPNVFADGNVYVLDKSNFVNEPDAGNEWYSESDQMPLLVCKVSKDVAKDIYITGTDNDTVFPRDPKAWEIK